MSNGHMACNVENSPCAIQKEFPTTFLEVMGSGRRSRAGVCFFRSVFVTNKAPQAEISCMALCVRDPPKPKGYLHYQLIEYLSVCIKMGPRGIARNTSQHEATINCILRGSRQGLCFWNHALHIPLLQTQSDHTCLKCHQKSNQIKNPFESHFFGGLFLCQPDLLQF